MKDCHPGDTPIVKGCMFGLIHCPKNKVEKKEIQKIIYALVVVSFMYAQVCTRPVIAFIVGMLRRYLSNPMMDLRKAAKWVIWYLKRTKNYMLMY